ncbi:hypothetical protein D3C87_11090 [compost metagenome]
MKNLALIFIALMGTAVVSHAQDGTKKTEIKKVEAQKAPNLKKKAFKSEERKKEQPIKKVN